MKDKLIQTTNKLNDIAFKIVNENTELKRELKDTQNQLLEALNIIDKAIEYIKDNNFYRVITHQEKDKGIVELDKYKILNILNGENNE